MITVWGGQTSRSIRVVWLMEEMGLEYRVRQVDMLAESQDVEFLAVNPANYIPAMQDGDVTRAKKSARVVVDLSAVRSRHLSEIAAPKKEFVVLKGGGHDAMLTMPKAFLDELSSRVRPFALGPSTN